MDIIATTGAVFDMMVDKLAKQTKTKAEFIAEFEIIKSLDDTMTPEEIAKIEAMIEAKFPE